MASAQLRWFLVASLHIVATAVAVESQAVQVQPGGAVLLRTERSETNQPIATCKGQFAGHCESFLKDESRCRSAYAHCEAKTCLQCAFAEGRCEGPGFASTCYAPEGA
ncbi:unnamed protein product [Symbiodinium sp. CCMP2456]|nr:unnamed protein product [Symbiodinium sp. CCMP2456]